MSQVGKRRIESRMTKLSNAKKISKGIVKAKLGKSNGSKSKTNK